MNMRLRADVYYPVQVPRETWMDKSKYMTVKELAEHYGRHADTIRRWIKAGIIPSEQPAGPRGWLLIRRDVLKEGLK